MSQMLALTFYPSSEGVRVALGRQARCAFQEEGVVIATKSFDWTWKDRSDPVWKGVPILPMEEFDALYGARK